MNPNYQRFYVANGIRILKRLLERKSFEDGILPTTFYSVNLNKQLGPDPFLAKPFEYSTVDGCDRIPLHGLAIRHYYHLSFQEHMKVRGNRKHSSDGTLLPYSAWNISQHHTNWLSGNVSCSRCGRVGESNALSLAVQLNKQIVHKYGSLVTDPAFHIYRGVPFPYPF